MLSDTERRRVVVSCCALFGARVDSMIVNQHLHFLFYDRAALWALGFHHKKTADRRRRDGGGRCCFCVFGGGGAATTLPLARDRAKDDPKDATDTSPLRLALAAS